ncbi:E3 ubiquitin-protein ligase TRIM32-like isoform X2 [Thrips palmi]|uniref:E3 ubiquitin-protein ligase TRIM32-like isoform X2 n=1 Tax=Thrips palmi TaxID=161013 RepID=A0A6P8Z7K8_THRPL|nr:E3 ubiquitin-protein ligase TRIM32-like isoform X2 [Thrips palmi]
MYRSIYSEYLLAFTRAMECQVCLVKFNAVERRPKVLPCGHTFCLHCLKALPEQSCPTDRKDFTEHPDNLVDNFHLLNVSEKLQPSLWCCSCQKEATSKECLDWHSLCSVKKARTQKATPLLDALKAALEAASRRKETMAKVRELVLEHSSRAEQAHSKLLKAQATLQSAVDSEHEDLARAMASVEQALAEPAAVKARPLGEDGGIFRVNVTLTQSHKTWSAGLTLKDNTVDQVFQGLEILTEGQLTWRAFDPSFNHCRTSSSSKPHSSPKNKTATAGPKFTFGAAISSASGTALFGSKPTGLFGDPSSASGTAPTVSFGVNSTRPLETPSSESSSSSGGAAATGISAPVASPVVFGAPVTTKSVPTFGLGGISPIARIGNGSLFGVSSPKKE